MSHSVPHTVVLASPGASLSWPGVCSKAAGVLGLSAFTLGVLVAEGFSHSVGLCRRWYYTGHAWGLCDTPRHQRKLVVFGLSSYTGCCWVSRAPEWQAPWPWTIFTNHTYMPPPYQDWATARASRGTWCLAQLQGGSDWVGLHRVWVARNVVSIFIHVACSGLVFWVKSHFACKLTHHGHCVFITVSVVTVIHSLWECGKHRSLSFPGGS